MLVILDKTGNIFKFTVWSKVLKLVWKSKRVAKYPGWAGSSLWWRPELRCTEADWDPGSKLREERFFLSKAQQEPLKHLLTQRWGFVPGSLSRKMQRTKRASCLGDPYREMHLPWGRPFRAGGASFPSLRATRQWEKSTIAVDGEVMTERALDPTALWGQRLDLTHFGSKSTRDCAGNAEGLGILPRRVQQPEVIKITTTLRFEGPQQTKAHCYVPSKSSLTHWAVQMDKEVPQGQKFSLKLSVGMFWETAPPLFTGVWNDFPRIHILLATKRQSKSIKTLITWIWQGPKSTWVKFELSVSDYMILISFQVQNIQFCAVTSLVKTVQNLKLEDSLFLNGHGPEHKKNFQLVPIIRVKALSLVPRNLHWLIYFMIVYGELSPIFVHVNFLLIRLSLI